MYYYILIAMLTIIALNIIIYCIRKIKNDPSLTWDFVASLRHPLPPAAGFANEQEKAPSR